MSDDERDLLALKSAGEVERKAALARLFVRYEPRLNGFFRGRRIDRATIDDLIQSTFLKIAEQGKSFRGGGSPLAATSWIWTVARHEMMDLFRRRKQDPDSGGEVNVELPQPPQADRSYESCVGEALTRMSKTSDKNDERAQAIRLVHLEQFSIAEAALVMGRSEGAMRQFLHMARREAKSFLEPCNDLLNDSTPGCDPASFAEENSDDE
jgi:RNA polymerase sigma-70 factor (ECF subfamily)